NEIGNCPIFAAPHNLSLAYAGNVGIAIFGIHGDAGGEEIGIAQPKSNRAPDDWLAELRESRFKARPVFRAADGGEIFVRLRSLIELECEQFIELRHCGMRI